MIPNSTSELVFQGDFVAFTPAMQINELWVNSLAILMADFKNKFQWSISRQRNFDKCKRLYYYNHYGMWGGWDTYAPEETKLCYRLSKMTNLQMLAGSVVHALIHDLFV
ncbi:MAG: hypothetical protein WA941_23470 [Nitrososphaeraceae archaeon]